MLIALLVSAGVLVGATGRRPTRRVRRRARAPRRRPPDTAGVADPRADHAGRARASRRRTRRHPSRPGRPRPAGPRPTPTSHRRRRRRPTPSATASPTPTAVRDDSDAGGDDPVDTPGQHERHRPADLGDHRLRRLDPGRAAAARADHGLGIAAQPGRDGHAPSGHRGGRAAADVHRRRCADRGRLRRQRRPVRPVHHRVGARNARRPGHRHAHRARGVGPERGRTADQCRGDRRRPAAAAPDRGAGRRRRPLPPGPGPAHGRPGDQGDPGRTATLPAAGPAARQRAGHHGTRRPAGQLRPRHADRGGAGRVHRGAAAVRSAGAAALPGPGHGDRGRGRLAHRLPARQVRLEHRHRAVPDRPAGHAAARCPAHHGA